MKNKVTFRLLSPVMCGGVKIADNFFESEQFIRGSVLRAAFAYDILLECPLADVISEDGRKNIVTLKDENGKCSACSKKEICKNFTKMNFSYAYKDDCIPAPFTSRVCKKEGIRHGIKDILVDNSGVQCQKCPNGETKRMENLKEFIRMNNKTGKYEKVKADLCLSTHTAISYYSDTAQNGSLFSVKAISKNQLYTAYIDDCDTGMLNTGKVIYAGKYSSCGFGKLRIESVEEAEKINTADSVEAFNRCYEGMEKFKQNKYASVLFVSDAFLDFKESIEIISRDEYMIKWKEAMFGDGDIPIEIESVISETQLYSGYDTSMPWGIWRQKTPSIMVLKGTSVLLRIKDGRYSEAVELLDTIENKGIGMKTLDGFGQVEICSRIHCMGV